MPDAATTRLFAPDDWLDAVTTARDDGFTWYDLLTAHDDLGRSGDIVVTLVLRDADRTQLHFITHLTRDDAVLPDISDIFAGASWGQRYVHEFYGVRFEGADLRPLLNHAGGAPLRKDVVLPAHATDTGTRRRRR